MTKRGLTTNKMIYVDVKSTINKNILKIYLQSQGRDNYKSAGDGDEEEHGEDYGNEGDEGENETSGQCRYECSGWPNKKCKVSVIFKVIFSTT